MFEFGTQYFPFDRKSFVLCSDQFNLTPDNHVREHIQVGLQGVESRWNYRHWNPWFNWKQHRWFVQTVFFKNKHKRTNCEMLKEWGEDNSHLLELFLRVLINSYGVFINPFQTIVP